MVFSDTVNNQGLIQDITFLTGMDTNAYTLKDRTRNINAWYRKIETMILQSQDEWDFDDSNSTTYPILTTPVVASQRDYALPSGSLKIKRVDISYDGTNYYKAEALDSLETGLGLGNDSTVDGRYAKTAPFYDIKSNSIWMYPRANASDVSNSGVIRIEISRDISEFATTDTTKEPGFDAPFHKMLSIGASIDWAVAKGAENLEPLMAMMQDYEGRLRDFYGSKDNDRVWAFRGGYVTYN